MPRKPDTAWLRRQGDTWCVDTNYMRQVFKASPEPGMQPPKEYAEQYIRALELRGFVILTKTP